MRLLILLARVRSNGRMRGVIVGIFVYLRYRKRYAQGAFNRQFEKENQSSMARNSTGRKSWAKRSWRSSRT